MDTAEIGSTYINSQDAFTLQTCLIYMWHPQPPTKLQIDNTTAEAFYKGTLKQKLSTGTDMRFYWLQDRETQGQVDIL